MTDADQRKALREAIMNGPAYRLAHEDVEFLAHDDLRPLRLQLELLKPEHELRTQGIGSTVVVFGSARVVSQEEAQAGLADFEARMAAGQSDPLQARDLATARRQLAMRATTKRRGALRTWSRPVFSRKNDSISWL